MAMAGRSVAFATAAIVFAAAIPADAAAVERTLSAHAASSCQAALPAFDGALRKRPSGIRNEGTQPAFVTCSLSNGAPLVSAGAESDRLESVSMNFRNGGAAPVLVTCTAVSGFDGNPPVGHDVKAVAVPVGGQHGASLGWSNGDFPQEANLHRSGAISVSCSLPPAVEITATWLRYRERFPGAE